MGTKVPSSEVMDPSTGTRDPCLALIYSISKVEDLGKGARVRGSALIELSTSFKDLSTNTSVLGLASTDLGMVAEVSSTA